MIFTGFVAGVTADALRCRYVKDKRDSELGSAFVTPLLKSSASKNDPSQAVHSKLEEPTIVKETERAFGKNESFEDSDSSDLGKESKSFLANLLPESGSQSRDKEKEDKTSEKESEEPMSKEVENQDDSRGWLSGLLGSSEEADKESGPEDKFTASEKEPSGLRVPFKDEAEATMEGAKTWFSDLNTKVHEKIEELQPSEEKPDQDDNKSEASGWLSGLLGSAGETDKESGPEDKSISSEKEPSGLRVPFKDEAEATMEEAKTWFSDLNTKVHEKIEELQPSEEKHDQDDQNSESSVWFSSLLGTSNKSCCNEAEELKSCIERCLESPRTDEREKKASTEEEEDSRTGWFSGSKSDTSGYEPDEESDQSGWFSGRSNQADTKEKQQHLDEEEPDKESYSSGWFSGWFGSTRPAERDTEESGQEDESIDSEKEPSGLREEAEATLEGAKAWFSDLNSKVHEKIDEHLPDRQSDEVKADENNSSWWFSSSSPEKSSQLFCGKTEDPREESKSTEAEVRGLLPSIFSGSSTQTDEESQEPKEPVKEKGGSWWPFSSRSQEDVVKDDDDDHICCEMATLKSCKKEDIKIRVCGILSVEEIIRK